MVIIIYTGHDGQADCMTEQICYKNDQSLGKRQEHNLLNIIYDTSKTPLFYHQ
jgi:hypothetical protein